MLHEEQLCYTDKDNKIHRLNTWDEEDIQPYCDRMLSHAIAGDIDNVVRVPLQPVTNTSNFKKFNGEPSGIRTYITNLQDTGNAKFYYMNQMPFMLDFSITNVHEATNVNSATLKIWKQGLGWNTFAAPFAMQLKLISYSGPSGQTETTDTFTLSKGSSVITINKTYQWSNAGVGKIKVEFGKVETTYRNFKCKFYHAYSKGVLEIISYAYMYVLFIPQTSNLSLQNDYYIKCKFKVYDKFGNLKRENYLTSSSKTLNSNVDRIDLSRDFLDPYVKIHPFDKSKYEDLSTESVKMSDNYNVYFYISKNDKWLGPGAACTVNTYRTVIEATLYNSSDTSLGTKTLLDKSGTFENGYGSQDLIWKDIEYTNKFTNYLKDDSYIYNDSVTLDGNLRRLENADPYRYLLANSVDTRISPLLEVQIVVYMYCTKKDSSNYYYYLYVDRLDVYGNSYQGANENIDITFKLNGSLLTTSVTIPAGTKSKNYSKKECYIGGGTCSSSGATLDALFTGKTTNYQDSCTLVMKPNTSHSTEEYYSYGWGRMFFYYKPQFPLAKYIEMLPDYILTIGLQSTFKKTTTTATYSDYTVTVILNSLKLNKERSAATVVQTSLATYSTLSANATSKTDNVTVYTGSVRIPIKNESTYFMTTLLTIRNSSSSGTVLRMFYARIRLSDSGKTISCPVALNAIPLTLTVNFTTSGGSAGSGSYYRLLIITSMKISSAYPQVLYVGSTAGYVAMSANATSSSETGTIFSETYSGSTPSTNVTVYVRSGSTTGPILAKKTLSFTSWGSSQTFDVYKE